MNEGKIIEEKNVSEKIKNYTMFPVDEYTFLVDERVHEEFQRITAQLNNGIEFSMEFIKNTKLGIKHIMLIKYQNELLCL